MNRPVRDTLVVASLLFAAACFFWFGASPPPSAGRAVPVTPVSLSPEPRCEPKPQAIETITVGQRMWIGENPSAERDHRVGADITDPSGWRQMTLRCPKRDGTLADVTMLRPVEWLAERRVRPGGQVDIDVPECGISGLADVLAVEACPEIAPGPGRVVTATFHHHAAQTIDVVINGLDEPIGTTPNHPFWSETEQDFVRADQLRPGDYVRTLEGLAQVASITPRGPPEPVYNLEVQFEHVYRVGEAGVLVHNGGLPIVGDNCWRLRNLTDELPRNRGGQTIVPDSQATGAHTVLGTRKDPKISPEPYRQGVTFDANGNPLGRTDVTTHGRGDHTNPHWHPWNGKKFQGGSHPIP